MEIQNYEILYSLSAEDFELVEDENIINSFIFQGSKNWDMYFLKRDFALELDEYNKVTLLASDNKNEFEHYINNNPIIDYSLEHVNELNKYFILVANLE